MSTRFDVMRSVFALALALLLLPKISHAQSDRERQQMLQVQQQVQKLRSENTQLQQAQAQEAQKAREEVDKTRREAGQLRASGSAAQREAKRLGDELVKTREALQLAQSEIDKLKAEISLRDTALANEKRGAETAAGVLGARLKVNTARADLCEARHESSLALSKDVIALYEARQMRACEPFTGLWRVEQEKQIQALRDRWFESRLDVPPPAAGPTASPADSAAPVQRDSR